MTRHSILIIESDAQLSVALELFFRGRSYTVRVANTAGEAMSLAADQPAELALIGNLADSMDAGSLAQRLRAGSGAATKVIVLSHAIDIAEADLVIPMGAHPRAILDGIRTLARRRSAQRPAVVEPA